MKSPCSRPGTASGSTPGSQIVMQVHYNLLAGDDPDVSATQLRLAAGRRRPRPPRHTCCCRRRSSCRAGPATTRRRSATATPPWPTSRSGSATGRARPTTSSTSCAAASREPGEVQSCTRTIHQPMTIMGVAGHMHLLGRSIRIEVNPGTDRGADACSTSRSGTSTTRARSRCEPVHLDTGDTVRVTCRHVQWLRDQLPGVRGTGGAVRRVGRGHHRRDVPGHPRRSPTPERQPRTGNSVGRRRSSP